VTRAQQAGLRVEDLPRPSLAKLRRRHKLDAQVRQALGLVLRRRPAQASTLNRQDSAQEAAAPREVD